MGALRGLRAVIAGALVALAFAVNLPGIALAFVLLSLAGWAWPYGSPWRLVDEWREREEAKDQKECRRCPATASALGDGDAERVRAWRADLRELAGGKRA